METYVGIEIGGTKLQIVAGNQKAEIIQRFRYTVNAATGAEGIRKQIAEAISKLTSGNIKSIGVGFGGPVDLNTGKIWNSYHVDGWSGFPLKTWLQQTTGVANVVVENDANVAAFGEALKGAGTNNEIVFYVTLGSGVGGGLVINRKIFHGAAPGEIEIGHVRLNKSGKTVQSSCSGWAVNEKIIAAAKNKPHGALAPIAKHFAGAESKSLIEALRMDDPDARRIFTEMVDDLTFGLSHIVHIVHPEIIVLGGGLSLIGEPLRKLVEEKISSYLMDAFQPGPAIKLSKLGEDAVPVGALLLAIQNSMS